MKITDKQKAQLRDELVGWIETSMGDEEGYKESIADYVEGLYRASQPKEELLNDILYDFSDVKADDNTCKDILGKYKDPQCFFYGYRAGRKIFVDNLFFDKDK